MASPSTICVAITEHWVWLNTSIICFRQGGVASITSSASSTAKGSLPTSSRAMSSVAQPHGFLLAHVSHMDHVGNLADDLQQVGFLFLLQHFFQLVAGVEMVFDGLL